MASSVRDMKPSPKPQHLQGNQAILGAAIQEPAHGTRARGAAAGIAPADATHIAPAGGDFLTKPALTTRTLAPEAFDDEQRAIGKTARDLCDNEILPQVDALDAKSPGLMQKFMHRAAELGLTMGDVPEAQGGLGLDKATGMLINESLGSVSSFTVTFGAHTGIGTLPLVYYGSLAQQQKYLPRLMNGEWLAAYALSEQGSGSDALGAKTQARLTADGEHYVLSGSKQWITNAAWADLFTVFAQVDGNLFTAFLVERTASGLSIGKEEHKLGIRGSSTCQIILDEVRVPRGNVLGEVGRGHKIAFNILNIGRYKLGIGAVGLAKYALREGVRYAKDRQQFKKSIASFELIREKFARSATLIYAGESMCYRLAGDIDVRQARLDKAASGWGARAIDVIDDFTVEASIIKVFCSEVGEWVGREMLQVHGGNGYTVDYPLERVVRDSRINCIFEGTNEINRLIIPQTLLKRASAGTLPLFAIAQRTHQALRDKKGLPTLGDGPMAHQVHALELAKCAVTMVLGLAAQTFGGGLKERQSILGGLGDATMALYAMDSVLARASQVDDKQAPAAPSASADALAQMRAREPSLHRAYAKLYCFEAQAQIASHLRRVVTQLAAGEAYAEIMRTLSALDPAYGIDLSALQDQVAGAALTACAYTCD